MAIHHLTPPFSSGERPRLPSAQVGPVTQAIRAMRSAPHNGANVPAENIREQTGATCASFRALSRTEVEDLIGCLIDFLDAMDGDTDLEVENEHGGDVQDEPHDAEQDERDTAHEWSGRGEHVFTVGGLCS